MFTGIVQALCKVEQVQEESNLRRLTLTLGRLAEGLVTGASVAVNGVCLTAVKINPPHVQFDVIEETLRLTNLGALRTGSLVNVERSYRVGDEVGGHIVSGHVTARVQVTSIAQADNLRDIWFEVAPQWLKFLHHKGFAALDGASLTLAEVDGQASRIRVSLIPETIERTTLGKVQVGDWVNLEIDAQTQAVVETVERVLADPELLDRLRLQPRP